MNAGHSSSTSHRNGMDAADTNRCDGLLHEAGRWEGLLGSLCDRLRLPVDHPRALCGASLVCRHTPACTAMSSERCPVCATGRDFTAIDLVRFESIDGAGYVKVRTAYIDAVALALFVLDILCVGAVIGIAIGTSSWAPLLSAVPPALVGLVMSRDVVRIRVDRLDQPADSPAPVTTSTKTTDKEIR